MLKLTREDEPLWPVVHRVAGATEEIRRRRVEADEFVRLFIWAGLEQVFDALAEPLIDGLGKDDLAAKEPGSRLRSLLAAQRVVDRINNDRSCRRRVTRSMLRDRWEPHSRFVADVLTFAVYRRHWSVRKLSSQEIDSLTTASDFASAISHVAFVNLRQARESGERRLHFLAMTYADSDLIVSQALHETYEMIDKRWTEIYSDVLRRRGLNLRQGITIEQIAAMLTALDEGLTMRMLTDPRNLVLGTSPEENLLGLTVRALIAGCIDAGDGESVNVVVNRLAADHQSHGHDDHSEGDSKGGSQQDGRLDPDEVQRNIV